jgi:hypothetical protein
MIQWIWFGGYGLFVWQSSYVMWRLVHDCGESWGYVVNLWVCICPPLAGEVAIFSHAQTATCKQSWQQFFHVQAELRYVAQVMLHSCFFHADNHAQVLLHLCKQGCGQARGHVGNHVDKLCLTCGRQRDSETHYCAFFSWQAYIGYVIITVPSKGKSPVGNTQKS